MRSSVTYLVLRLLGIEEATNYDASWGEWGSDEFAPKEK